MADRLDVVSVYPDLLGTYGDRGNVLALAHRAAARGIEVRIVEVSVDERLPRQGDLYLLGGGEDSGELLAARALLADPGAREVLGSRPCLAVCAGLQLLADGFEDASGGLHPGLGVLDARCGRLRARAVGEVVSEPVDLDGLPTLTGFENHAGTATLGPAARPLGRLVTGVGNGDGAEGVVQGAVVATYLHGPVLVRNPGLADLLLARAVGGPLPAYDDEAVERLRRERLDAAVPWHRLEARLTRRRPRRHARRR